MPFRGPSRDRPRRVRSPWPRAAALSSGRTVVRARAGAPLTTLGPAARCRCSRCVVQNGRPPPARGPTTAGPGRAHVVAVVACSVGTARRIARRRPYSAC